MNVKLYNVPKSDRNTVRLSVCAHMDRGKLTCGLIDAFFLTPATSAMHPLHPTYNS